MSTQVLDTSKRVIEGWDPSDEKGHWDSGIAWRTLWISTFSLICGFCVWYLVSAIAPRLNDVGFDLSKSQLYWLASVPGLAGGTMRLIYMVLPPFTGTRKLVGFSSLLFILPAAGWFFAVQDSTTPFWWLMVLALLTGIGGGAFAGYMPSTGYFFPKRLQGTAMALQSGLGTFGISLIQLLGPWVMGFGLIGAGVAVKSAGGADRTIYLQSVPFVLIPWALIAALVAFTFLKDVPVKANIREQFDIFRNANTWRMTLLYGMTFGAFSGMAAQFALLVNNTFGSSSEFATSGQYDVHALPAGAALAFLPPLIGALVRAAWGPLCDRFGGAIWTFICGIGMTVCAVVAGVLLKPSSPAQFTPFLITMLVLFFFTGLGNAGVFKQIPMIFEPVQSGAVTGWTAAIASFGPFVVGMFLTAMSAQVFFFGCAVFFAVSTVVAWVWYARPGAPFPG